MASKQGIERLSARQVQCAKADVHDGGGLAIRVPRSGGGSPTWVYRFTAPDGRRRELGLGVVAQSNVAAAGASLVAARKAAAKARDQLRDGVDPIEHAKAQREQAKAEAEAKKAVEQAERHTLARVARAYYEEIFEPKDAKGNPLPSGYTDKHSRGWINSLEQHVPPKLWDKPIADVTHEEVRAFILAIRRTKPEAGKKIAQRLRKVFNAAERKGFCRGNPVAVAVDGIKDDKIKFSHQKVSHIALPFAEVPAFVAELRQREAIAARALLFGVYTWARTGEIIGATWAELHDLDGADPRWIIAAERMKMDRPHTVPLVPSAVAVLRELRELAQPYVFPNPALDGRPLSNMAMLNLVQKRMRVMGVNERTHKREPATPHGICRQTPSTWANELDVARPAVVEAALAHVKRDAVEASYNKATYLPARRALLTAWADYVDGRAVASNVIPMQRAA